MGKIEQRGRERLRIEGKGEWGGEGRAEVTEVRYRQMTFNPVGRDLWLKAQRDLGAHISASNQFYACSKSNSVSSLPLNLVLSNVENAGIGKQFLTLTLQRSEGCF